MIKDNIDLIKNKIADACRRSNRNPGDISVIAVTKTVPVERVKEAIQSGIDEIGENKVQEAQSKIGDLPAAVKKHFIGHLQTNKAKKAVELFDVIQSVDSLRLAQEINKSAAKINKIQDCLLEIKVSEEETKFGLSEEEAVSFLSKIEDLKNLRVLGIMAMAPYFDDKESYRPYFKKAKEIFNKIRENSKAADFNILSMGMSNDFEVAIEEGSNMVRIGTAIFGARNYQ
ncbi:MAG: YggS family pyridoxal phosphate-dependent enzyme [Endomicrobiales bacterium]|nr:YggS family pyridoxal phosphate-dependent enzyme [Endomicrobiales bacterium]